MTEGSETIFTSMLIFLLVLGGFAVRVWRVIASIRIRNRQVLAWRAEVSRVRREDVRVGKPPEKS
jgi:hypothetical protein